MKKLFLVFPLIILLASFAFIKATDINDTEYFVGEFTVKSNNSSGYITTPEHIHMTSGNNELTITVSNFYVESKNVNLKNGSLLYFQVPEYVTRFVITINDSYYEQLIDINGDINDIFYGDNEISYDSSITKLISITNASDDNPLNVFKIVSIKFYSKFSDYKTIVRPKIKFNGEELTKTAIKFGANIEKNMYEAFISEGYTFGVKLSYMDGVTLHERCFDLPDGVVKLLNDNGEIDVNGTYYQFYCVINLNLYLNRVYTGVVYAFKESTYYYFTENSCSFNSLVNEYYNSGSYITGLTDSDKDRLDRYFARIA